MRWRCSPHIFLITKGRVVLPALDAVTVWVIRRLGIDYIASVKGLLDHGISSLRDFLRSVVYCAWQELIIYFPFLSQSGRSNVEISR